MLNEINVIAPTLRNCKGSKQSPPRHCERSEAIQYSDYLYLTFYFFTISFYFLLDCFGKPRNDDSAIIGGVLILSQ